jgi:uncharacterized protein GlcG (DUF336 family)
MSKFARCAASLVVVTLLMNCSGEETTNEGVTSTAQSTLCTGNCTNSTSFLTQNDVKTLLVQGIKYADSINAKATFSVVDRVGNVLAVYRMNGANTEINITSHTPSQQSISGGLEGIRLPQGLNGDALAAISKAMTAAYISSEGNAFSTRTAAQIIQEHFNPGELNQPAGPLFGVQFSQLACSDFSTRFNGISTSVGPHRSPLGLSADEGGFPLYRNGALIGGIGVVSDNFYDLAPSTLSNNVSTHDAMTSSDETIALAASFGFYAPLDKRANRITVDGKTLAYAKTILSDLNVSAANAADFDALIISTGQLIAVTGYANAFITKGVVFGQADSGIRADSLQFSLNEGYIFVDASNQPKYQPTAGADGVQLPFGTVSLSAQEVTELLNQALSIANKARAQIRKPLGSQARVTIAVVDSQGNNLGMVRTLDAPVFGADVALQKARTATLFSSIDAASFFQSMTQLTNYLNPDLTLDRTIDIADYVEAAQLFISPDTLNNGIAFTDRAGGNLSRPFFPDGIDANVHGPFSKSFSNNEWSIFSTGLQLDLVMNQMVAHLLYALDVSNVDVSQNCVANPSARVANGIQIFPGSVPIYRNNILVGAIGVSGDGVDQDDMIAFLAVHQAGEKLNTLNNAPSELRADNIVIKQQRLRYVQCPQSPFINNEQQLVCKGK